MYGSEVRSAELMAEAADVGMVFRSDALVLLLHAHADESMPPPLGCPVGANAWLAGPSPRPLAWAGVEPPRCG